MAGLNGWGNTEHVDDLSEMHEAFGSACWHGVDPDRSGVPKFGGWREDETKLVTGIGWRGDGTSSGWGYILGETPNVCGWSCFSNMGGVVL